MSARRCFKCQALGHIAADYPNQIVITLVEWEAMKEEEKVVKSKHELEENEEESQVECLAKTDEGS